MRLKMTVRPEILPVTLTEAKRHARVGHSHEDDLVALCISAATADCETLTRRQMVEATFELALDSFPGGAIVLPRPPVSAVESVRYSDSTGAEQALSENKYILEGNENTAFILPIQAWPGGSRVRVIFRGGWPVETSTGDSGQAIKKATTPDALKQWILVRSTGLYEQRTNLAASSRKSVIPMRRDFMGGLLDGYTLFGSEVEI